MTASPTQQKASQEVAYGHYLARIAEADSTALAALYDETSKLVYSIVLMIVRRPEDAEEVTLDVYTSVWNNAKAFDGTRGSVTGWLILLARSRAIDRLRSRAWRQQSGQLENLEFVCVESSPETQTLESERHRHLRAALGTLSPEERELLVLAFFQGQTHRELAEQLQQPLGTVKTRIRTAMLKLRNRLSPCFRAPGMETGKP